MIAPRLDTSTCSKGTVRGLQRALYRKAKHPPGFRFYSLYDKVYRSDVLQYAYDLVRRNGGSPGLDGESCASVEAGIGRTAYLQEIQASLQTKTYQAKPVKRVEIPKANGGARPLGIPCLRDRIVRMAVKLIMEPIFEADFSPHSYGFRPRRSAHQALDAVADSLLKGHVHVIDADLSRYFDTIPHGKLLKAVAERIVDSAVLSLLKQWLKARIIKEARGQRTVVGGGKKTCRGTPQGGVISPLLANVYLNILDRIWDRHGLAETHKARLVRYADDRVILCANNTAAPYAIVQTVLDKLGLTLNESKTQIRDARQEAFGFLGFRVRIAQNRRSGKHFPLIEPSGKALLAVNRRSPFTPAGT